MGRRGARQAAASDPETFAGRKIPAVASRGGTAVCHSFTNSREKSEVRLCECKDLAP